MNGMGAEYRVGCLPRAADTPRRPDAAAVRVVYGGGVTDGRPDHGFSLAPGPIGVASTGRARRRRISAVVVLFVAGSLIALASFGPKLGERPSFNPAFFTTASPSGSAAASASAETSETPSPLIAGATPLPPVTRNDDGRVTGMISVLGDGFKTIDLSSGMVTQQVPASAGLDTIVASPIGPGWICICSTDQSGEFGTTMRQLDFVRINADGTELDRATLGTFGGDEPSGQTISIQTDLDLAANGRSGVIAVVVQTQLEFTSYAATIDLVAGSLGPTVKLGTHRPPPQPAPSGPPPQPGEPGSFPTSTSSNYGPLVRVAPAGDRAFVWLSIQLQGQEGPIATDRYAWRLDLGPNGSATAAEAAGLRQLPDYCGELTFVDVDRFVGFCRIIPMNGYDSTTTPTAWTYFEFDRDGQIASRKQVPDGGPISADMLFDVANGAVWTWSATDLVLARVDLATLHATRVHFDPAAQLASGPGASGGHPAIWRRPVSASQRSYNAMLAGSPAGDRLYLLGFGRQDENTGQQSSVGIFVVDVATLALVGHWAADASYIAVQSWADGSIVVAAGAPDVDSTGHEAPWESSLTMHDASDGRILLRLGQLGQSYGAAIVDP